MEWIVKDNHRRQDEFREQALRQEATERQKLDSLRKKKRRRLQQKSHAVEIELTERQSNELLYVAFKPTRKDLCKQR